MMHATTKFQPNASTINARKLIASKLTIKSASQAMLIDALQNNLDQVGSNQNKFIQVQIVRILPHCNQYHKQADSSTLNLTDRRNIVDPKPMILGKNLTCEDLLHYPSLSFRINDEVNQPSISLPISMQDLEDTWKKHSEQL